MFGKDNDLLKRIADDKAFKMSYDELEKLLKPEDFVGMAPEQTQEFINNEVEPIIQKYKDELGIEVEINV